ncbi:MAG: Gfo/Idh/MocA family oxidoreductase [Sedimentisphaerales bacterium]|nr:Gfo/Idh/MocA family oxidoreductase [Sedimentisphaerales bacterium]
MRTKEAMNRREFIKRTAASGIGLAIVPAYVLGGAGRQRPSDKLNIALVGAGTQGLGQLTGWIKRPDLQFVSVCDPNRETRDYPQWGRSQGEKFGAAGGREVGRRMVNQHYAQEKSKGTYKGCSAYADFREMLEKEKNLDAVFIMTPDHLHATIAIAAMKRKVMAGTHKPIANFMYEARLTCETAKETGVPTQLFAFQDPIENYTVREWIKQGVIGKVKELHRWTNRPVWPQGSPYLPTNTPPIPEGFDWDLWLGPSLPRTYSPDYTHTVFRGWYEFGGGCLADMGYYGFWVDWRVLNLGVPTTAEADATFTCEIKDFRSSPVGNELSFPYGATIRWKVPVKGTHETMEVFWYEGGIRPRTPDALMEKSGELTKEGVMFVGEKGIILADYGYANLRLLGVNHADEVIASIIVPEVKLINQTDEMVNSFKGGKPSRGDFINARTIAEAICLGNLAIRTGRRLQWDEKNLKVANIPEANQYVRRQYRRGWEL